jgi:hypothetical protein
MEVSERTREIVDSMSMPELLIEFHKQNQSKFQNEGFAYLKTRIDLLNAQEEGKHKQQTIQIAQEANSIAENANMISQESLETAKKSLARSTISAWIAVVALVISVAGVVVAYFHK